MFSFLNSYFALASVAESSGLYMIMPSENRDSFTVLLFYFKSGCLFFLIAKARTASTMLNGSCETGHHYLVPDLRGKHSIFTFDYDVNCGLFMYSLF